MEDLAVDRCAVVSSESDLLILVDENDNELGSADKGSCHDNEGILHRAFSVLIFNSRGELLLQKRAPGKRLWGGYWSNSCCSHPRWGETMEQASERRLMEELGLTVDLTYLYKFQYHADFGEMGAERELCWVYLGVSDQPPRTNSNEISEWRYIAPKDLDAELNLTPEAYTPWFKMEWQALLDKYPHELERLLKANSRA